MKIIIALLIFGLIVTFHELGHFLIAKKNGIAVSEFSIGMGPRLASFVKNGTRYSLKLLPLGGSCAMGEDEVNDAESNFNNKSVWARISTIFAGPFFNFILAFLLALIVVGTVGYDPARIVTVPEGSNAEAAGLQAGDVITRIDGNGVVFARDIVTYLQFDPLASADPIVINFKRNGESMSVEYTPGHVKKLLLGIHYDPTSSVISQVTKGSVMDEAGVVAGDEILSIDGVEFKDGINLASYLEENPLSEEPVEMTYDHNGKTHTTTLTPRMTDVYSLDFSYNLGYERTNVWQTIRYSFSEVRYWIQTTVKSIGKLITGQVRTNELGGPVRIVSELGSVVEAKDEIGIKYVVINLLNWAIFLSANLGVMNLIPIPALDGGRLFFLIIEAIRGKRIDPEKEGYVHGIGFILLMLLMVFIFFNDIKNIFF